MPSRLQGLSAVLLDLGTCSTLVSAAPCGLHVSSMVLPASEEMLPVYNHCRNVSMLQVHLQRHNGSN